MNPYLKKLEEILGDEEYIKSEDFAEAFILLTSVVESLKEQNLEVYEGTFNVLDNKIAQISSEFKTKLGATNSDLGNRPTKSDIDKLSNSLLSLKRELVSIINSVRDEIPEVNDLTPKELRDKIFDSNYKIPSKFIDLDTSKFVEKSTLETAIVELGGKIQLIQKRDSKGYGGLGGGSEGTGSLFLSRLRDVDLTGLPFINGKYQLYNSGGGGTTYIVNGTNTTVTGSGTLGDPYQINATGSVASYSTITGNASDSASLVSYVASQIATVPQYWNRTGTSLSPVTLTDMVGLGIATATSHLHIVDNAIGAMPTDATGIMLENQTAAAAAAQQASPSITWSGNGWKTTATAASQPVKFQSYVLPVQGTTAPSGTWTLQSSINNAAYANALTISSAGNGVFTGTLGATSASFSGSLTVGLSTSGNFLVASGAAVSTSSTIARYIFPGTTAIRYRAAIGGTTASSLSANDSYANTIISASPITEAATGTHPILAGLVVQPFVVTAGAATTTRTASLYIPGAPTATVTDNNYGLYVDGTAPSYFSGELSVLGVYRDSTGSVGTSGQVLSSTVTGTAWIPMASGGTGTVTSVSVVTANGVSGSVATATTTPAITLTLGAITPTSVNGITFSGSGSLANSGTSSLTGFTGSGTSSGTNTGDQTITLTGDVTGSGTGSFATAIAAGVIVNADINASAAIALTKLATVTANRALVSDGSGFIVPATTTATEIGYVNGVTSSIQTQLNAKQGTITLTTTGTSGAATLVAGTLNIPQYANTTYSAGTGLQLTGTTFSIDSTVVTLTGAQALSNKTGLISQWTNDSGYTTNTGTVTSVSGTTNRITVATGTTTPVIDISATFEALLGKVASPLSQFASTTSSQLAGVISDETGSGALVFATSPTLVTPALGTPSALVGTNITGTGASFTAGQATAALGLKSATTTVSVSSATAPSSGQVLTATSSTAATWQTPTATAATTKTGVATRDTSLASGSQTIAHGLGRTPLIIKFTVMGGSGSGPFSQSHMGTYDGSNKCVGSLHGSSSGTFSAYSSTSFSAALASSDVNPSTTGITGTMTADATNITIAWTKNGSPTGTFPFLWEVQ